MSTVVEPSPGQPAALEAETLSDAVRARLRGLRGGELGSLPILLGLLVIVIVFQSLNENFLSPSNFVNLMVQMAGLTTIAMGIVFVLLLGEIDLSVGYVSGVAGVSVALLLFQDGGELPGPVGIAIALVIGAAIGFLHGMIITKVGVPSFVVTLAGLLAWNGVVLLLMAGKGTVIVQDELVVGIANSFLPETLGWIVILGAVGLYGALQLLGLRARARAGLPTPPPALLALRVAALAAIAVVVVWFAYENRGIPYVAVLVVLLLVCLSYVANRTRFGRHVYAIGGNQEAAQRAGINVDRVKVSVFMIAGTMAALGGIIFASRLRSVDTAAGGGDILLNSIAAAVIGGTSLFGGRGHVKSALLGALIIASIANGMGLLGLSAGAKFVVTGVVLLAAVTVDAVSRRGRASSGRA